MAASLEHFKILPGLLDVYQFQVPLENSHKKQFNSLILVLNKSFGEEQCVFLSKSYASRLATKRISVQNEAQLQDQLLVVLIAP